MPEEVVENPYRVKVEYGFTFDDKSTAHFDVDVDLQSKEVKHYSKNRHTWTELCHHQCEQCPLSTQDHKYCPAIVSIVDIIEYFSQKISFTNCKCEVRFPEKTVVAEKPLQDVLYSLIGLRLSTSLCPLLSQFKPMARFHEPFSSPFYTVYRATSLYLLRQYFKNKKGEKTPWELEGLRSFYSNINAVNSKISERLKSAEVMDAAPNSIMILSLFGTSMTYLFDDFLGVLEKLFECSDPPPQA